MKKNLYLLFLAFIFELGVNVNAQVTIGSQEAPVEGAILELRSDKLGFLPPRVVLSELSNPEPLPNHVEGMVVYNTKNDPSKDLQTGLYYNDGSRWIRFSTLPSSLDDWFYMPSIVFDVSETGKFTKNLYDEYTKQFGNPKARSGKSPDFILPKASDLNYYILDYDSAVFNNVSVDETGKMAYEIINAASDATYINIVFVKK